MADLIANDLLIYIGTAGVAPAVALTQVTDVSHNLGDTTLIDTTTIGDGTQTNKPGTHAPLQMTVTVNLDPSETSHSTIISNKIAKTRMSFGVTTPDTGAAIFWANGHVESLEISGSNDDKVTASITFTADSAFTFTA